MELKRSDDLVVPFKLVESIRTFPLAREVTHCGEKFAVPPFDIYAKCPRCGNSVKVRALWGGCEIEDVFDAVFE